ncbi:hypothetical protein BDY24DRAFT_413442 [Mrakia frigida]|uniref:uncharacterized protein n=1 Tax=Mrakia frigida TaxID=29902 RepID=UPI003FCC0329
MPGIVLRVFVLTLIALLICSSLASWIVAGINVRVQNRWWGWYSVIDPSFLVAGVFAFIWFLAILLCNSMLACAITAFFSFWFLGEAIAYSVRRWQYPTRCPSGYTLPSNCRALYRTLLSLAWIDFGLSCLLIGSIALLAVKYSEEYSEGSGADSSVWELCSTGKPRRDVVQNEKGLPPGTEAAQQPVAAPGTSTNVESTHV